MTTMIERVARAMENALDVLSYEDAARAAIEAMREPTEAMVAAFDRDVDDWFSEKIADPMHLYKAMIDAALKETTN